MTFELQPEKKRFLRLAIRSATDSLSKAEREELDGQMQRQPALSEELLKIKAALQDDPDERFMEICLRVLFQTASLEELDEIDALKASNPRRWEQFQQMRFILQVIGDSAKFSPAEGRKPEPMPEHVRTRLLNELKEKRQKASGGGKK